MAGRDASANLGGMLSQIGGAIGGMGGAGEGLMRPIMTSFRPQLDPKSVESLQRQAAFQGRIGDTEQARLFTNQALALEERNRLETERKRKLEEGQAQAKAITAYTEALSSKDPIAIKAAEAEAMRIGELQGINMLPRLAQAEQRLRASQEAEFSTAERARIAKERAENQAVDKATEALAAAFNRASTVEEMDALLEQAGPLVAEQAQQLRDRGVARLDKDQQRRLAEAEQGAQLSKIDDSIIPTGDALPPALVQGFTNGVAALNKEIDALNSQVAGKKIVPNSTRQDLERRRNALERRIYGLGDQVALTDYRTQRDLQQSVDSKVRTILASNVPKNKVDEARKDTGNFLGYGKDDYLEVENRIKRKAIRDVYIQAGLDIPEIYQEPLTEEQEKAGIPYSAINDGVTVEEWTSFTDEEKKAWLEPNS